MTFVFSFHRKPSQFLNINFFSLLFVKAESFLRNISFRSLLSSPLMPTGDASLGDERRRSSLIIMQLCRNGNSKKLISCFSLFRAKFLIVFETFQDDDDDAFFFANAFHFHPWPMLIIFCHISAVYDDLPTSSFDIHFGLSGSVAHSIFLSGV